MFYVNWKCLDGTMHERSCVSMEVAWEMWHIKIADKNICDVTINDVTGFRVARWMLLDKAVDSGFN